MAGKFFETIKDTLTKELKPLHLEVIDESHLHMRRTAATPETHFKVIIVSDTFRGLSRVRRQQLVYSFLERLFKNGLHALTQSTFTPEEWAANPEVHKSPDCGHKMQKRGSI